MGEGRLVSGGGLGGRSPATVEHPGTWRSEQAHLGIDPTGNMDCIEHTGSEVHQ